MSRDITAANAVLTLSILPLFPIPQQLQGFATDDIYTIGQLQSVETMMGVDGKLSGGFVYKEVEQEIRLQADSDSGDIFDAWWSQMQSSKKVYTASGVISIPAIQKKYIQSVGFLTGYKPAPDAKKLLQPRSFKITWETILPAPTF